MSRQNKNTKIAIIGAGIAGLATAALLKLQNFDVVLFEKFLAPQPVGSGLILQQTGLAVLANLGLAEQAVALGVKLTCFEGKTLLGKTIFDLEHRELHADYFSLGIHRHSLFQILYDKVLALNIPIITACKTIDVEPAGNYYNVIAENSAKYNGFDLVVNASGAKSHLRNKYGQIKHNQPFAYGALWGVCESDPAAEGHILQQRFHEAKISIGLIPIGKKSGGDKKYTAFHWSICNADYNNWQTTPFTEWRNSVIAMWPETESLIHQFKSHADLTYATYSDVQLRKFYTDKIVFIGDACHAISPRLGQGANLGLMDALILSRCLSLSDTIDKALEIYDKTRKNHVRFYHQASRTMAVLFQSDNALVANLRDISFSIMNQMPYMRRQMLQTLGGLKIGLFANLNLADIHPDYNFSI